MYGWEKGGGTHESEGWRGVKERERVRKSAGERGWEGVSRKPEPRWDKGATICRHNRGEQMLKNVFEKCLFL